MLAPYRHDELRTSDTDTRDILDLTRIAEWAERQEGEYDYADNHNCALCQYLRGVDFVFEGVGAAFIYSSKSLVNIPDMLSDKLSTRPHTFSALASRLRAASRGTV